MTGDTSSPAVTTGLLPDRRTGKASEKWRARAGIPTGGLGRYLGIYLDERLLPFSVSDSRTMAELERCVGCGNCLSVCPVVGAAAPHGYPGPRAVGTGLSRSAPDFWAASDLVGLCTTCMACEEACPGDVPIYQAILMMRARNFEETAMRGVEPLPRFKRLVVDFFSQDKLAAAARWGAALQGLAYRRTVSGEMKARVPLPMGPLGNRVVPPLAAKSLADEFPETVAGTDPAGPRVAVYAGCLYGYAYTDTGRSLVEVLRRHSREVLVPAGQVCCGAPALYSGDLLTARRLAAENSRVFEATGADFVVTACATCGDVLTREYPRLYEFPDGLEAPPEGADDAARVLGFSRRVRDIHEFLCAEVPFRAPTEAPPITPPAVSPAASPAAPTPSSPGASTAAPAAAGIVTIHDPCHLVRGQGIHDEVRRLIQALPGVTLVEMKDASACCGGAGSFSLDHYDIAKAIRSRKVAAIEETRAGTVVTGCPSCRTHLSDGLERAGKGRPVRHLVDLLGDAYRAGERGDRGGRRSASSASSASCPP